MKLLNRNPSCGCSILPSYVPSDDDEKHAAGYVLNKLYTSRCFGRRGNKKHNRHTQLDNMPKGFPKDKRGTIKTACQRMDGILVLIFSSDREDHICALHDQDARETGLKICNFYRKRVGLPPLDLNWKELISEEKENAGEEIVYRRLTEKEKRAEEYKKKIEKWMKDQELEPS